MTNWYLEPSILGGFFFRSPRRIRSGAEEEASIVGGKDGGQRREHRGGDQGFPLDDAADAGQDEWF